MMTVLLDAGLFYHALATCIQRGFLDALDLYCDWSDLGIIKTGDEARGAEISNKFHPLTGQTLDQPRFMQGTKSKG